MYNNYFANKIALVTGGGSGIGRGLCLELAAAGAVVICSDIDLSKALETVQMTDDGKAVARQLDVSQQENFEHLVGNVVMQYGRIDLLFNNAGIGLSGELRDVPMEMWKKVIDINFYGVLYGSQAAYGQMLKQGSGHIVNIASGAGIFSHLALMSAYSVAKQAVVNYTRILRTEAKAFGVKATVVCPGFVNTSIGENAAFVNADPSWYALSLKMISKGISTEKAARTILKGVAGNREVIIFPFGVKVILFFSRLFKGLYRAVIQRQLKDFRKNHRVNN